MTIDTEKAPNPLHPSYTVTALPALVSLNQVERERKRKTQIFYLQNRKGEKKKQKREKKTEPISLADDIRCSRREGGKKGREKTWGELPSMSEKEEGKKEEEKKALFFELSGAVRTKCAEEREKKKNGGKGAAKLGG